MDSELREIDTKYGQITVKIGLIDGNIVDYSPEYEDCKKLAEKNNILLKTVYQEAKISSSEIEV